MTFNTKYKLFYKTCASALVVLHIFTTSGVTSAFAFTAQSPSYKLNPGAISQGGKDKSAVSAKIWQDSIGEAAIGKAQSASYILNAGFISMLGDNPPQIIQSIPNQNWLPNETKTNVFDLDDFFASPDGLALTYSVSGNNNIAVTIDAQTHLVSFTSAENWYGSEDVIFTATDSNSGHVQSNLINLQVVMSGGGNPPVLDFISDVSVNENELVSITPNAVDADNEPITYSFSTPLNSQGQWQIDYTCAGTYTIMVTATDSTGLVDKQAVSLIVKNVNRPPVLEPILDITINEGQIAQINPVTSDPDGETVSISYNSPFDQTGKWLTSYEDSGTYDSTILASDGTDVISQPVRVIVNNVNRAPQAILTLSKYTVAPREEINVTLNASDPDNNPLTFSLRKDGEEIASGVISQVYTMTISFSSFGDKTVTAIITDSEGLTSGTVSRGVDVYDPNANRDAINPIMGDFNGDSLTDLGIHNSDTGKWEICLSNRGVFNNAVDWLTGFGTTKDNWPLAGDFNGDGKTDAATYNNTNGQLHVALSSGSNFAAASLWLAASFVNYNWQPVTGNFNADKYTDFALYDRTTGEIRVALGNGSGFGAFTTWANLDIDYTVFAGDFNGDGITDICLFKKTFGEFKVVFSNTNHFVDSATWLNGFSANIDPILADFNNDGLTDVGYWDKTNLRWYYAVSTGGQFIDKGLWLTSFGAGSDESVTTADFNGDGVTDQAAFDKDGVGINRWRVTLSTKRPADLITEINNGIGGKTQITYTYAATSGNEDLPFPVYVTAQVASIDTLPADKPIESYTQNFNYTGGYFDFTEREFRGFGKVTVTDPITNNFTETYFYQGRAGQNGALKGQIEKIIAYDGNNRKISETQNTYEVITAGPVDRFLGFPSLKEVNTTVWEVNGSTLSTKDNFTYDNIGNIIDTTNYGDTLTTGDEKSAQTTYAKAYDSGFNRPLHVVAKDSNQTIITQKWFEYDSRGNLSKESSWLHNPLTTNNELLDTNYGYDSFGNVTLTTNAKGQSVSTQYETTLYAYPETVTNSLGHTITYAYDYRFGTATSVTDANGMVSQTILDSLGRVIQTTRYEQRAANDIEILATYQYPDFNTKITTNAIGLTTTEYIDGLGRKYKTVSSGEDGAQARQITSETFYNPRGFVDKESIAHYIDEDENNIAYTRYEYDIRGRVVKTIADFPGAALDTESRIDYISPLYTETFDPKNHKKGTLKDVFGNVKEITEFTSGGNNHTYYDYDTQNSLIKLTDTQGNITQMTYDSLGRKLRMIDPDMGTWLYEYDELGNLVKQTDAKNQELTFQYDNINRLIAKRSTLSATTLAEYQYDDSSKNYCIGRLSKITYPRAANNEPLATDYTEFFYDKYGREIKSIKTVDGSSYLVSREYDILNRLTKLTYPDNSTVSYSYDINSGLLEKVFTSDESQATSYVTDITYNAKGQIKQIQYGNNTQTNYTYGSDLRLSRILTSDELRATNLQDLNYQFDLNGNVTTLTDNLKLITKNFSYDDLDRLTQANNISAPSGGYTSLYYQYDPIGNMTYKSDVGVMSYGMGITSGAGPHAVVSAGAKTYTYDANGNQLIAGANTYSYDTENRLISANDGLRTTSYEYDGDGGRVRQLVSSSSSLEETTYIGSLYEIRTANSEPRIAKHIFAGSNKVCTIETSPTNNELRDTRYFHTDHLGSSSVITDENGNKVTEYEYEPYGKVNKETRAASCEQRATNYLFTGKELDSSGLYFYSARYYDPEIGRFTQPDTIVQSLYDSQSLNRYSYCRNNPINYIDPTGHFFWFVAIAIAAAIGGAVGGVSAAVGGGSIGMGILTGALGGALTAAGGLGAASLWGASWAFVGAAAGGAVSGASSAAINGSSIGAGALTGFIGGAVGGLGGYNIGNACGSFWGALGGGILGGGVAGGIASELAGGNFGQGFAMGAAYGAAGALAGYGAYRMVQARQTQTAKTTKLNNSLNSDQKPDINPSTEMVTDRDGPYIGEEIFRVFDGIEAEWDGKSWTPENPNLVPNYRVQAGLPNKNTGRFVAQARIINTDNVIVKEATVIYGNGDVKMIREYRFKNPPNTQIELERISGANPEF